MALSIMALYGRSSRCIFHLFRRYNSKIPPRPLISTSNPNPRIYHRPTFTYFNSALKNTNSNSNATAVASLNTLFSGSRISPRRSHSQFSQPFFTFQEYGSRISHPIIRNLIFQNSLKDSYSCQPVFRDLFFKNSKIKESAASQFSQPIFRNLVLHKYVPMNTISRNLASQNALKNGYKWWNQKPRYTRIVFLLGCGAAVYFWNLETIPYTERTHFVLPSTYVEKVVGEFLFEFYKSEQYEGEILPSNHPESIRVEKIGHDIIGVLHKHKHNSMKKKKKKKKKKKSQTAHFEEFEWEVIVVDDPTTHNAFSLLAGKIVIFTGMLNHSESDDEIAATIAHEVGHVVARHSAEIMSGILWLRLLQSIMPDAVKKILDRFVRLPLSRRDELEADYIGLLLMASAGYDPQVAIELFDQNAQSEDEDYLSTHPSNKKRAQLLSKPEVMEEAISLYREALMEKLKGIEINLAALKEDLLKMQSILEYEAST